MSAPATPVIQGARSVYQTTDSVSLSWYTDASVSSSQVKVYDDGEIVSTQSATGTSTAYGKSWSWSATASSLAAAGSTVTCEVTATNSDGTSSPARVTFGVYAQPNVTLTSPADQSTMSGYPLVVAWSVTDPTGVAAQRVRVRTADTQSTIYDSGGTLLPSDRTTSLYLPNLPSLENGHDYVVELDVTDGVGLTSTEAAQVRVSWTKPASPTLDLITPDPTDGTVSIVLDALPTGCSATIVRVTGSERVTLYTDLGNVDVVDALPPLGVAYTYEAYAINSVSGAASDPLVIDAMVPTTRWALNFGEHAEECLMLYGNPRETYGLDQGGTAYHFADGGAGRGLPVWYGTTDRDISGTTSFDTVLWHEADRLQELCDQHDLGWLRDPHGHRRRVHMSPKVSHGVGEVWQVTVSWDEMRWEEPTYVIS